MLDRPTIPPADWRLLTAGCQDQSAVRRVVTAYQVGFSAGQRSICAAIHESVMRAFETPRPPSEDEA